MSPDRTKISQEALELADEFEKVKGNLFQIIELGNSELDQENLREARDAYGPTLDLVITELRRKGFLNQDYMTALNWRIGNKPDIYDEYDAPYVEAYYERFQSLVMGNPKENPSKEEILYLRLRALSP